MRSRVASFVVVFSCCCFVACADGPVDAGEGEGEGEGEEGEEGEGEGDAVGPAFDDTYALFVGRCDGCHAPDTLQGNLDLSTRDDAWAQLVGAPAGGDGSRCGDAPHTRVIPGDPDHSLLLQKLDFTMDCGLGMPLREGPGPPGGGATPFSADELATVRAWIEGGARDR